MRIIYYSPHPTHDIVSDVGYSTHQREMIGALRAEGHEVLPVILGGTNADEFKERATQISSSASRFKALKGIIPPYLWRSAKERNWWIHDARNAAPRLESAIQEFKPELVYERSEYSLKQGPLIARKHKIKHIFEVNAPCVDEWMEFEGPSLFTPRAREIERIKYLNSDGLCPVSSPLGNYLSEEYDIDKSRVSTITNGINPTVVNLDYDKISAIRNEFGLTENSVVVGFVGSILEYHGVDHLLDEFAKVAETRSNALLLIVGDGALLNDLRQMASALGIDNRCRFTGRIAHVEVFNYMSIMDICVSPRHSWYGSPIKLFEYAFLGKAIVAPDQANIKDVLTHEQTAMLLDDNSNTMASHLAQLIDSKELRVRLGSAAQQLIQTSYTWEANAKRLISFADQLNKVKYA